MCDVYDDDDDGYMCDVSTELLTPFPSWSSLHDDKAYFCANLIVIGYNDQESLWSFSLTPGIEAAECCID